MSEQRKNGATGPRKVFERFVQTVVQGDRAARADLYADDAVQEWPFPLPGMPRRIEGGEANRAIIRRASAGEGFTFDEARSVVVHDTGDPEVIIVEFELYGRNVASGEPVQFPYIWVLRARGGKIASLREYNNPLVMAEAFGGLDELRRVVAEATGGQG